MTLASDAEAFRNMSDETYRDLVNGRVTVDEAVSATAHANQGDDLMSNTASEPQHVNRVTFSNLDRMLGAWETYDGDVSGFIVAWVDHLSDGEPLPRWAA